MSFLIVTSVVLVIPAAYLLGSRLYEFARISHALFTRDREMMEQTHGKLPLSCLLLISLARSMEGSRDLAGHRSDLAVAATRVDRGGTMNSPRRDGEARAGAASRFSEAGGIGEMKVRLRQSELSDVLDAGIIPALSIRCGVVMGAVLAILGLPVSAGLSCLMLVSGMLVGYRMPTRVVEHRARDVMDEMNRAIPVMLEIVAMSSRAGMSLDQALSIYCEAFGGPLSRRMRRCMAEYLHGVRDRDQAMRIMADELDLPAFRHFTETAVESLRFGVPMTDALEELARQVRDEEKAAISARIAKAPVKMLLPMGLFMLPAMLLLTLGPVVMNMMAGMA